MGSVVIDTGHYGGWIRKFVLFEKSVQSSLEDLFISNLGELKVFENAQSQDSVSISGSIESDLIVLGSFPVVVQSTEPFVDGQVMKCDIRNYFLFKGRSISVVVNTILETESSEFSISIKTFLNWFWNRFTKGLNEVFQSKEVTD